MADGYTPFIQREDDWHAELDEMSAVIHHGELRLYARDGSAIGHFPLGPRLDGGPTTPGDWQVEGGVLTAPLRERPESMVELWVYDGRIHYLVTGQYDGPVTLGYFPGATFAGPRWHTFVPDAQDINHMRGTADCVVVTMSSDRASEEILGRQPIRFITPAPRACALEYRGGWLAMLVPRPLPVAATTFSVGTREDFDLTFTHYLFANADYRGPEVVLAGGLGEPYQALDALAAASREMGESHGPTPAQLWWTNPYVNTWGEQVWMGRETGAPETVQTVDRICGWVASVRVRMKAARFTVVLNNGWYQDLGDFHARAEAYGDDAGLRGFIHELHQAGHHVLLWLLPFALDRTAKVTREHAPNSYLIDREGNPLSLSHAPLIRDFTYPPMREQYRQLVQRLVGSGGLDADGLVLTDLHDCPDPRVVKSYDPSWGVGDQLGAKVIALTAEAAREVKQDALITAACAMPYLQRALGVVRLNDVIGADTRMWWRRARLISRAMPGSLIDHGGWALARDEATGHWMTLPVYSIPSLFHVTHLDDGTSLTAEDDRRIAATWAVYDNAPLWHDQRIVVEPEEGIFARYYPDGRIAAQCVSGHTVLITASVREVRACSCRDTRVVLPITDRQRVLEAMLVGHNGTAAPLADADLDARPLAVTVPDAGRTGLYLRVILQAGEMAEAA